MAIREGKWDCPYCRSTNRGRDEDCGKCGARRDDDVVFYLADENAPEVSDPELLAEATIGPDWLCESCSTSNRDGVGACQQCGAGRGSSPVHDVSRDLVGAVPGPGPGASFGIPSRAPRWGGAKFGALAAGCGCLAVVAVVSIMLALLFAAGGRSEPASAPAAQSTATVAPPREVDLRIEGVSWIRSVTVQELRNVTESAWDGEVPVGASVVSRERGIHHTDKVQTGTQPAAETYTERVQTGTERVKTGTRRVQTGTERVKTGTRSKGNGFFEDVYTTRPVYRDEPVYDNRPVYRDETRTRTVQKPVYKDVPVYRDRVTYTIDRWVAIRVVEAQGDDLSPRWPDPGRLGPKQQTGGRSESYTLRLVEDGTGARFVHTVPSDRFASCAPGSKFRSRIDSGGRLLDVTIPVAP